MKKKNSKIKTRSSISRCPPKAKVVGSTPAGCTTLPLPGRGQVVEIPKGYEIVERLTCEDFVHKRTLFIRQTDGVLFENYLKSRRARIPAETRRNSAEKPRARSA